MEIYTNCLFPASDWTSSNIFLPLDERPEEQLQQDLSGNRDLSAEELKSKVVVIRKHRKPAARSQSMRPLSMSCLVSPSQAAATSAAMTPATPATPGPAGGARKRILIKPDPSFLRGVGDDDSSDDSNR